MKKSAGKRCAGPQDDMAPRLELVVVEKGAEEALGIKAGQKEKAREAGAPLSPQGQAAISLKRLGLIKKIFFL
jgi:hypothetical protein